MVQVHLYTDMVKWFLRLFYSFAFKKYLETLPLQYSIEVKFFVMLSFIIPKYTCIFVTANPSHS